MGKKYIIEIPEDKIADFVGSTHFLMPYMMAGHIGHHDTGLPIEPYTEPDLERVKKTAHDDGYSEGYQAGRVQGYQEGLFDAWRAARKIIHMTEGDLLNLFDVYSSVCTPVQVMLKYDASEVIEKIRQYEQEQEEFQVGDEVEMKCGVRPAIYMQGTKGSDEIYLLFNDGSCGLHSKSEIERKTGRHFPEIATILEKMRGEQDD